MIDFSDLKKCAIANLEKTISDLEKVNVKQVKSFEFSLTSESLGEVLKEIEGLCPNGQKVVYGIRLLNHHQDVYDCYASLKDGGKIKASEKMKKLRLEHYHKLQVSKLNEFSETSIIYVGSSNNYLPRFKQHMGLTKSYGTYSLHLRAVLHNEEWVDKLRVELFVLPLEKSSEVIKLTLEDTLWGLVKPSFGKSGGK